MASVGDMIITLDPHLTQTRMHLCAARGCRHNDEHLDCGYKAIAMTAEGRCLYYEQRTGET